jgi:excinuclease UvrABC nuclease subunit
VLTERLEFLPERDGEVFAAVPAAAGVFLLWGEDSLAEPYLTKTANLRRRLERLLSAPEERSRRLNLRGRARWIEYARTGSDFESGFLLYRLLRQHFPKTYADRLRFRFAPLVKFHLENEYPRASVTTRLGRMHGETLYYGPFPARATAEKFLNDSLDFFKMRRCVEDLQPDPAFPGCIYSEMKMCLAPCFAGCTKEEYDVETGRVLAALASSGEALTEELERDREAASDALDFERAAGLHKRLEKASAALRGLPEVARRIDELDAVILQRATEEKTIIAFPVLAGLLAEPIFIRFGELSSEPRSVEAILKQGLEGQLGPDDAGTKQEARPSVPAAAAHEEQSAPSIDLRAQYGLRYAPAQRSEHLAILARWFYSKPREGEIFFREDGWPYRRLLRACGRLLAPVSSSPSTESSA